VVGDVSDRRPDQVIPTPGRESSTRGTTTHRRGSSRRVRVYRSPNFRHHSLKGDRIVVLTRQEGTPGREKANPRAVTHEVAFCTRPQGFRCRRGGP
jgi:hypothetical protein